MLSIRQRAVFPSFSLATAFLALSYFLSFFPFNFSSVLMIWVWFLFLCWMLDLLSWRQNCEISDLASSIITKPSRQYFRIINHRCQSSCWTCAVTHRTITSCPELSLYSRWRFRAADHQQGSTLEDVTSNRHARARFITHLAVNQNMKWFVIIIRLRNWLLRGLKCLCRAVVSPRGEALKGRFRLWSNHVEICRTLQQGTFITTLTLFRNKLE